VHSSLGLVNRELCAALLRVGRTAWTEPGRPVALPPEQRLELSIEPLPPAEFSPVEDPGHLQALAERFGAPLSGPADIHVCLSYPPRVTPTIARRRVIYQPWEYTSLPRAWFDLFQYQADEVWVPSVYVRRSYVEGGIRPDKVHVIPHGVRPAIFHPAVTPLPLATAKRFRFLFVGGTLWRKGIDILLDAYTRAFRRRDDVCLVIKDIGVNSYYRGHTAGEQIRHLQQDPDAPEILYMTEEVTDNEIARIYTACDCLVHPYRGEGFALPVAEAMACALPVIVTRGGACDDYCGDDHAYWLPARLTPITIGIEMMAPACVLEPDRDALIAQLQHVFTHRDEGRQKGRTASQHILSHFTWEQAARAVLRRLACLCG
jgi:glycosyltransferase involved in cell wall biosynthesis